MSMHPKPTLTLDSYGCLIWFGMRDCNNVLKKSLKKWHNMNNDLILKSLFNYITNVI
jgi:hypothetical protein